MNENDIKYIIKIWYWNYKDINSNYSSDAKEINFEILDSKTNNRITLMTFKIPSFMDGMEIKDKFIKSKYEIMEFIPCINYSNNFSSNMLKYNNFEVIEGKNCTY